MAVWLITGANRGIGLELAKQAASAGHKVIATARNPASARELRNLAEDRRLTIVEMDVTDPHSIAKGRASVGEGPIDLIVNNAGVIGPKRQSVLDMDFEGFESTLATNVIGPLRVTQAFLANLRAARGAKIAAISSLMGSFSYSGAHQTAYCVSKTALNRLMKALAAELKSEGIAVGIYSPGWVRTDMGGPNASLAVEDSAAGLIRQFATLSLAHSGEFRNYDGKPMSW